MSGNDVISAIEKLKGAENYHTWVFATENALEFLGLEKCIIPSPNTETDAGKLKMAKARIALSVTSSVIPHIQNCKTALEMWTELKALFEDKGVTRKIGLLRKLLGIRLDKCDSMNQYVKEIIDTSNKLSGVGFAVTDEWVGAILLAGLTDEFKPMIMAIENSGIAISGHDIKSKLVDYAYKKPSEGGPSEASAFAGKGKKPNKKTKTLECFVCGKKGHFAKKCKDRVNKYEKREAEKVEAKVALSATKTLLNKDEWILDSGASHHMTPNEELLVNKKVCERIEISAANNKKMSTSLMGNRLLSVNDSEFEIKDVLCVPELAANLLSVKQIVNKGNSVVFNRNGAAVYDSKQTCILRAQINEGVYMVNGQSNFCMVANSSEASALTWHRRLGHINYKDMCKMRNGIVDGINFIGGEKDINSCEVCFMGKQTRKPFTHKSSRTEGLLNIIHSDLCGPMEETSIGGAKYFLTFIDDHSRMVFVYFLKTKSETFESFKDFKSKVENKTGKTIKIFRTDNGSEFCSKEFEDYLRKNGIQHQTSNVYTPQQNGISERMNRTLVERARCMIFDAKLEKTFWAEAVNTAAYVINRSVCSALNDATPYEIWMGKKPDIQELKVFGSRAMVHVPKERRQKWCKKSQEMIFIGYSETTKGYRCFEMETKKVMTSRDVIFIEEDASKKIATQEEIGLDSVRDFDSVSQHLEENHQEDDDHGSEESVEEIAFEESDDSSQDETYVPEEEIPENSRAESSRPKRERVKPKKLDEFVTYSATGQGNMDPSTLEEALSSINREKWKTAMENEMKSLKQNGTWKLVDLPSDRKAIKSKWVFKTKRDQNGNLVKHKARLVAKGCSQRPGVDYSETYSPVVRYSTIRYLIALSVKMGFKIDQMDAVTAFLHGDLEETIYMEQPEGQGDGTTRVCKLKKAIYGLKQSGRLWNIKLDETLKKFGLQKSKMDPCVYFTENLIVSIYVDDILIFWKEKEVRDKLKATLSKAYKMKDMGEASEIVGLKITRNRNDGSIYLDQSKYTEEILARFNMSDCKPMKTPSDVNQKLSTSMCPKDGKENDRKNIPYQEAVGSLLYLAQGTRPDIAFAVNDVSRFNNNFGKAHWSAVKRIFRYLKATPHTGICYSKNNNSKIQGYSDSDWASDVDKRRSCTGYVFTMSSGAITWASKRQPTVALSSTEAEYMALSASCQEAVWLKQLAEELDPSQQGKLLEIKSDNQSAISLIRSDGYRARSKHIDVRHHYIRQKVEDGIIEVNYIPTEEMAADHLTKAVSGLKIDVCNKTIGVVDIEKLKEKFCE